MESDKIQRWLTYFFTFSGGLLVFAFSLHLIALFFEKYSDILEKWDYLGFLGAIIGGAMTLIGVRMTLKNQFNREYLDKYPRTMDICHDLLEEMSRVVFAIQASIETKYLPGTTEEIKEILERKKFLLEKAANTSSEVYNLTRLFCLTISILKHSLDKEELKRDEKVKRALKAEHDINNYINDLNAYIESERKKYSSLKK